MLRAVLFDVGNTLTQWEWDDALLDAGHRAGLAAVGRDGLPEAARLSARWRAHYEPLLAEHWDAPEEVEYPGLVRDLLRDVGVELSDEELFRYLDAEHAAWAAASRVGSTSQALLESLRARGLKLGLVSNAFDPPELLRRDMERYGLAGRVDSMVFSSEVGFRKPRPEIFERALGELGVAAAETVFVGDKLYQDIRGASGLGMTTVQALWFVADDHPEAVEPDFQAFTQMDVLNIVDRLLAAPQ
jgi:putative hydrolase of the HAD superfamily